MPREPERIYFRIVIGCYSHDARLSSARRELLVKGLPEEQLCTIAARKATTDETAVQDPRFDDGVTIGDVRYHVRKFRELALHVTSARLFDRLWSRKDADGDELTEWMTPAQSETVWNKLCDGQGLLMASASSSPQQIEISQIQLKHRPTTLQAFNFTI